MDFPHGGQCGRWRAHKGSKCKGPGYARNTDQQCNGTQKETTDQQGNGGNNGKGNENSNKRPRGPPRTAEATSMVATVDPQQDKRARFHEALEMRAREDPTGLNYA